MCVIISNHKRFSRSICYCFAFAFKVTVYTIIATMKIR
nr:MAG TPA: hypothetical protein [Caudoviricetes sp.]DAO64340.1 MAG TPA: hypothetical protein [Caudoviricetes sp.]